MPIGGAAIIGSSIVGGIAQNSAAKKNAKAAQAIANQNQQAIQGTQAANNQLFAPFVERGNSAGDALNAFLGLPTSKALSQANQWDSYLQANPDVKAEYESGRTGFSSPQEYAQYHYDTFGKTEGRALPTATTTGSTAADSKAAFDNYLNSTGYQFTANAGRDAINSSKATSGLLKSGSALKALEKFSAGNAQTYTQNYINNLYNQQQSGLSAAGGNASSNANVLGQTTQNNSSVLPAQVAANSTAANVLTNIANQAASAYGGYKGASSYGAPGGNKTTDWNALALEGGWS